MSCFCLASATAGPQAEREEQLWKTECRDAGQKNDGYGWAESIITQITPSALCRESSEPACNRLGSFYPQGAAGKMTGGKHLSALPGDTGEGRGIRGAWACRQWSRAVGGKELNRAPHSCTNTHTPALDRKVHQIKGLAFVMPGKSSEVCPKSQFKPDFLFVNIFPVILEGNVV